MMEEILRKVVFRLTLSFCMFAALLSLFFIAENTVALLVGYITLSQVLFSLCAVTLEILYLYFIQYVFRKFYGLLRGR